MQQKRRKSSASRWQDHPYEAPINLRVEMRSMATDKRKGYICIICPNCCELQIEGTEVRGAHCERGEEFVRQEAVLPLRVITTSIRCKTKQGTKMVPVKTASPVALSHIPDIMKLIKQLHLSETPPIGSRIALGGIADSTDLIVTGE